MDQLQETISDSTLAVEDMENQNTELSAMEQSEPKGSPSSLDSLKKMVDTLSAPEEKIAHLLTFMEQTIAKGATPSFKDFWEVRKLCLNYFKEENLPFGVRAHLWNKYVEVSKEAYRLKEILDEQSAFAVEQIDLAVKALENDISNRSELSGSEKFAFDPLPKALAEKASHYCTIQVELSQLNAFAARINSLRKELIKTEMRIRNKNQFFKRLSAAGDAVFPRRKELIKSLSTMFMADVRAFIEQNFKTETFSQPLFALREEIKALQGAAKVLTLNTQAFNQSRMELSECWDVIKRFEKDVKKEKAKEKAELKDNATPFYEALEQLKADRTAGALDDNATLQKLEEISNEMRDVKLGRDDVKKLRADLGDIRFAIQDKHAAAQRERLEKEREEKLKLRERFQAILSTLDALVAQVPTMAVEAVEVEVQQLKDEAATLNPTKWEKQDLERRLRTLRDAISQSKIQNLPADARMALEQLQTLLKDAQERRREVREQLEAYRKTASVSGFDLEQALQQKEMVEAEKERLQGVEDEIAQIQKKISNLNA